MLQSISYPNKSYIGMTNNLGKRIKQHNGILSGGAKYTKCFGPWKLIFYISGFVDKSEAMKFEWRMKHPIGNKVVSGLKKRLFHLNLAFNYLPNYDLNLFIDNDYQNEIILIPDNVSFNLL